MRSRKVSKLWRLYLFTIFFTICKMEKIKYISLERPVVSYCNKKYIPFFNVSARRYSRDDPKYYISGHGDSIVPLDNRILVDIFFYKSSGNTYKRTFFELHYRLCDLLNKDTFLGSSIKKGTFKRACPFPAGSYHVENITIPIENVPVSLPLKKGRICVNTTYETGERMGTGYIDIEIKEKHVNTYFYNYWGNTYKRTFFELHYRLCDLLHRDKFLISFLKKGTFMGSCLFSAVEFHVEDCSIRVEDIPVALPLKKGRIYLNLTYMMEESLGCGYFDIEIKLT